MKNPTTTPKLEAAAEFLEYYGNDGLNDLQYRLDSVASKIIGNTTEPLELCLREELRAVMDVQVFIWQLRRDNRAE